MNNVILGYVSEKLSELVEVRIKIGVVDQNSPSVRGAQSAQGIKQCRFAGTTYAQDGNELALVNLEVYLAQGVYLRWPNAVVAREAASFDEGSAVFQLDTLVSVANCGKGYFTMSV